MIPLFQEVDIYAGQTRMTIGSGNWSAHAAPIRECGLDRTISLWLYSVL